MTNKYPAKCRVCGSNVPVNGGFLSKRGWRWSVVHMACVRKGRSQVATIRIGDKEFTRNVNGRCEDAPCCGCCTI